MVAVAFVDSLAGAIPGADVACFVVSTVANNKVEIWAVEECMHTFERRGHDAVFFES